MKKTIIKLICAILILTVLSLTLFSCRNSMDNEFSIEKIEKGMTYQEVVELMGNEGTSVGFGLIIYAWDISEDEALYVWFQKGVTDSWDDMTVDSFVVKDRSEISE